MIHICVQSDGTDSECLKSLHAQTGYHVFSFSSGREIISSQWRSKTNSGSGQVVAEDVYRVNYVRKCLKE